MTAERGVLGLINRSVKTNNFTRDFSVAARCLEVGGVSSTCQLSQVVLPCRVLGYLLPPRSEICLEDYLNLFLKVLLSQSQHYNTCVEKGRLSKIMC